MGLERSANEKKKTKQGNERSVAPEAVAASESYFATFPPISTHIRREL